MYIRGVTYGAFRPDEDGNEYHNLEVIERDFALMAANGMTAVRIPHTTPPRALLDIAQRHGLRVMVGLSAEQYVGYLIDQKDAPDIEELVRAKVRICAGHPALLCYAIGNEIPASMVRWLGHRRVERYLRRIYEVVKAEDPDGLVTYVNYPTTEYLQLPFLDLLCFNVYLRALRFRRPQIYHGTWGNAPFQSIYETTPGTFLSLPLMPEWYLIVFILLGLSALGVLWGPLLLTLPLLVLAVSLPLIQAVISTSHASFPTDSAIQRISEYPRGHTSAKKCLSLYRFIAESLYR